MEQQKIGKFIHNLRKEKELTQKQLADLMKVSDKTISNLKEVSSRGAKVIAITNIKNDDFADYKIELENYSELLTPLSVIVPMQLLAYNVAKLKGCDIDKPRNLAKSVTVE